MRRSVTLVGAAVALALLLLPASAIATCVPSQFKFTVSPNSGPNGNPLPAQQLPDALVNQPYTATVTISGNTPPYAIATPVSQPAPNIFVGVSSSPGTNN